jgi:hypothetical protein
MAVALDEYRTGMWHAEKLYVNTYHPIHKGILSLMYQIEKDQYLSYPGFQTYPIVGYMD